MQWQNGFILVENNLPQYAMHDKKRLAAIWQTIKHKFVALNETHYINTIIYKQRSKKLHISEKRSNIGKNGINKRWGNKTEEPRKPKNKLLSHPPSTNTTTPIIEQPQTTIDPIVETIIEPTESIIQQQSGEPATMPAIVAIADPQGKMFDLPPIIPPDGEKTKSSKPPKPPKPDKREWFAAEIEKYKYLCDDEKILQSYLDWYCNIQFDSRMYFETLRNFNVQITLLKWIENNKLKNTNTNARNSTGAANLNSKTIQPRPPGSYGKPQRNSIV
jgi:hypothetical protein